MVRFVRLCFGMLVRLFFTRQSLLLENLALRQKLVMLKRRHPHPSLGLLDELFGVIARRVWSGWKQALLVVKRQLWNYSGLGIETHDSAQYRFVRGELQRSKRLQQLRGLNKNHNHDLKNIFKSAATMATISAGPFHDFYEALLVKGRKPTMARLTLARKIAAITLIVWKKEVSFDVKYLKPQAA
jgi:hypothetical protein